MSCFNVVGPHAFCMTNASRYFLDVFDTYVYLMIFMFAMILYRLFPIVVYLSGGSMCVGKYYTSNLSQTRT